MTSQDPAGQPRRPLPRRLLVQGGAWSVPAVVVATSAPAFATSGQKTTVRLDASNGDASSQVIMIPANAHSITYTIVGGGGSGGGAGAGGGGSMIQGTLTFSGCTTSQTLWLIAGGGGGGAGTTPATALGRAGTGFGNGGSGGQPQAALPNTIQAAGLGGAGGGGSALGLGSTATLASVLTVAGGGGGGGARAEAVYSPSGQGTYSNIGVAENPAANNQTGDGGRNASGTTGEASILGFGPRGTTTYPGTIVASGGTGAVPPNPGAGGTVHTQTGLNVGSTSLAVDGTNGGAASGGGTGATAQAGTLTWTQGGQAMSTYISSGAGGGGYGGGGSGAIAAYRVTSNYSGAGVVYSTSGVGGAGGAGGDFAAPSLGCVTNTTSSVTSAANGGSAGQHGGQGYVEVTYYV